MKILPYVDLGKSFETLKKTLTEVEKEVRENQPTVLDTGMKYAKAYGRLSAAVQCHIAENTDTPYSFLEEARKTAENALSEAPTLYLHDQLNWKQEEDDLPNIYETPGTGNYLAD